MTYALLVYDNFFLERLENQMESFLFIHCYAILLEFSNIKKTYTSIGKINTERFEGSVLTVLQCSEYLSV